MADSDGTLDSGAFDPLTAPRWPMTSGDFVQNVSPIEFEVSEDSASSTSAPKPPDVDEILRGEYTGWIPLIKAGESFEEAKARAQGVAERALERERIERELRIAEAERAAEKLRQAEELRAAQQRLEHEREQTVERESVHVEAVHSETVHTETTHTETMHVETETAESMHADSMSVDIATVDTAAEDTATVDIAVEDFAVVGIVPTEPAPEVSAFEELFHTQDSMGAADRFAAEKIRIERERRLEEERIWAEEIRLRGGVVRHANVVPAEETQVTLDAPVASEQSGVSGSESVEQNVLHQDVVADPDSTTTPARALEDARKRIADLRKNLEHQRLLSSVHVPKPNPEPPAPPVAPTPAPTVVDEPVNDVDDIVVESIVEDPVHSPSTSSDSYVSKATTDVYEHSPAGGNDQSASVELMIMRDEVQHLREQLDASQKLIHDMMIRFANLAELAILNKN